MELTIETITSFASAPEDLKYSLRKCQPRDQRWDLRVPFPLNANKNLPKGEEFLKATRCKNRESAFRILVNKTQSVIKLSDTAEITLNNLETDRDQLDKLKDNFNKAHQAFDELLETELV